MPEVLPGLVRGQPDTRSGGEPQRQPGLAEQQNDRGQRITGGAEHVVPTGYPAQQRASRPQPPPSQPPPPPPSPAQAPAHVRRGVRGRPQGVVVPPRRVQDGQDAVDAGGRLCGVLAALLRRVHHHALPAARVRVQGAAAGPHLARYVDAFSLRPFPQCLSHPHLLPQPPGMC
ncbi:hypothetical protein FOCC_FOCC016959 [Frankliniella occidentalis]|nr:hypothetical protein FOCC_FOCC016959 [Frankliniella occidentalis]